MEENNPSDDNTSFLTPIILTIMEILPKDAIEKKGKTKQINIDNADEKKGEKPKTMQVELPAYCDDRLEKWKQQRLIVFLL